MKESDLIPSQSNDGATHLAARIQITVYAHRDRHDSNGLDCSDLSTRTLSTVYAHWDLCDPDCLSSSTRILITVYAHQDLHVSDDASWSSSRCAYTDHRIRSLGLPGLI